MVLDDPIESGEYRGERARAIAIENAYRNEPHRFRDAVVRSADEAGDMRAVTITVIGAVGVFDCIEARDQPAAEIAVMRDAGVDDVDSHADSRFIAHIAAVQWERALIDSVESP